MSIDVFDPASNPDPSAKPVEFNRTAPREMAPARSVDPNGQYMGVNEARQQAIMRSGYTPARAGGAAKPAEVRSPTDAYQDVASVRRNAAARAGNAGYESTDAPFGDIELVDQTKKQSSGGGGKGGGNGTSEKGFWTTGRIVVAVVIVIALVATAIGLSVAGALGKLGGSGETDKKPPKANPVDLENQAAGKVEIDILNGKDASGNAWVAAGDGTVSGSGVKLMVGLESKTSYDAAGEGKWSVDAATGKISFTPLASFTGSPTPVNFFVIDSNNLQSANAAISIAYASTAISPTASEIKLSDQLPGKITIDILNGKSPDGVPYVKKGSGALKGNGVFLVAAAGIAQKLPVDGEGEWLVDMMAGTITFTPDADFQESPTPVRWLVRDDSTPPRSSNEATITIQLKAGPVAVDDIDGSFALLQPTDAANVTVDVLANDVKGASAIDPKSVRLAGAIASDPSYTPVVTFAADMKSADVSGEGKWTVDPASGKMTFNGLQGFSGQTTAVTYTVADANGIRSNAAIVQLNSEIKAASAALQALVAGSDAAFWSEYKKKVIDDPAVSIREALVVTSLFADLFRGALPTTQLRIIDGNGTPANPGVRVVGAEFTKYEMQWLKANATKDELWTIMQTVQADRYKAYPEATSKGVVRYLCADVMTRLLRVIVMSLNAMQK